jgi:hypothetical protein
VRYRPFPAAPPRITVEEGARPATGDSDGRHLAEWNGTAEISKHFEDMAHQSRKSFDEFSNMSH